MALLTDGPNGTRIEMGSRGPRKTKTTLVPQKGGNMHGQVIHLVPVSEIQFWDPNDYPERLIQNGGKCIGECRDTEFAVGDECEHCGFYPNAFHE